MPRKEVGFRAGILIISLIAFGPGSLYADGLPPEEALPTAKAEEPASAPEAPTPPSEPVAQKAEPVSEDPPVEAKEPIPALPAPPAPPVQSTLRFFQGTIIPEPKADGKIVGAREEKGLLGEGDLVFLVSFEHDFALGKEWVVFKTIKDVYHPKTGEFIGDLIDVVGTVKIVEADKRTAKAVITRSKEPILREDPVALLETLFDMTDSSDRTLPEKMKATIVEVRDNRTNIASQDIVYIDRGKKDGIMRGDRFSVIRAGHPIELHSDGQMVQLQREEAGSVVIVSTQDHTATGEIVQSSEPISKGASLVFNPVK